MNPQWGTGKTGFVDRPQLRLAEHDNLQNAKDDFDRVRIIVKDYYQELAQTPEGRQQMIVELAALSGVHPDDVKVDWKSFGVDL